MVRSAAGLPALGKVTHEKLPEALMTAAGSTVFAESISRLYVCTGHDAAPPSAHDNQAGR
jgi:hypothetical protein